MMESVKRGGDRQKLHEIIRVHSHAAAAKVKLEGGVNDLIDRLSSDERIPLSKEEILLQLSPEKYIGRSVSQVEEFLENDVKPVLLKYHTDDIHSELKV